MHRLFVRLEGIIDEEFDSELLLMNSKNSHTVLKLEECFTDEKIWKDEGNQFVPRCQKSYRVLKYLPLEAIQAIQPSGCQE